MPRFFFHICDEKGSIPDEEGALFADAEGAKFEGEQSARELLTADQLAGVNIDHRRIEVATESGAIIAVYRLRDLLQ